MEKKLSELISSEIGYLKDIKINIKNETIKFDAKMDNIENVDLSVLPIKNTLVIYIIKANSDLELDYNKANANREGLINGRNEEKKKYAVSRISEESNWTKENKCLYVGQSKDIKKRLKEHLFINTGKDTYALRLPRIFESGSVSITLYEFSIDYNDNELNNKHLRDIQVFEDLLWQEYKPLFGRCGAK